MAGNSSTHWWRRFKDDLTNKEYIPIKVLYFLIYGGMMTLFPFLTLQARSLGIQEREMGIIYGFLPLIALLGPPLTGMFADKIGDFKYFLGAMVAASGLVALLYLLVPIGRIKHKMPATLPLNLTCGEEQSIVPQTPYECTYNKNNLTEVPIQIESCYLRCHKIDVYKPEVDNWQQDCRYSPLCSVLYTNYELINNQTDKSFLTMEIKNNNYTTLPNSNISKLPAIDKLVHINGIIYGQPLQIHFPSNVCNGLSKASYNNGEDQDCVVECKASATLIELCDNTVTWENIQPSATLISYIIIRSINSFTLATSLPLFEGAVVSIVKKNDGDFGLQRVFGGLGMVVMTPISGVLIDLASKSSGQKDFSPAFYLYCCLKIICTVVILSLNLEFKQPSNKIVKATKNLLKNIEVIAFLIVGLISGSCYGFLDTFLFWLLDDMGASKSLMGITVMVGSLFGIPFQIAATPIIQKLGHVNTFTMGFAFYIIRLIGYSLITNPWWCMPFECLECFTNALLSVAAVSYAALLSSHETTATLTGMYGGIHYGVGRGIGSVVGGFLMGSIGIRSTFQLMAVVCAVTCVGYLALNYAVFKRWGNDNEKECEPTPQDLTDETNKNIDVHQQSDICPAVNVESISNINRTATSQSMPLSSNTNIEKDVDINNSISEDTNKKHVGINDIVSKDDEHLKDTDIKDVNKTNTT